MMPLDRLLVPRTRTGFLLWTMALVLLAATGWLVLRALDTHRAMQADRDAVMRARASLQQPVPPKPSRADRDREKRWAALQLERDFKWYPIFLALENAADADIELLEFAPDKVGKTFVLRGEARDADALLAYLSTLSGQEAFIDVHLSQQKAFQRGAIAVRAFEIKGRLR